MSTYFPSSSYRRNLEPVADEIQAGGWRISPLVDLVSEKRFLRFRRESRAHSPLLPSVLAFRGTAATIIAPSSCPTTLSTAIEGDRIEFLTEHFDVLTPASIREEELPDLFDSVLRTLARFDRHDFVCGDLFPQAVGRGRDGTFRLLPNAYILPHTGGDGGVSFVTRVAGVPSGASHSRTAKGRYHHATLVARFVGSVLPSSSADARRGEPAEFAKRLAEAADAIAKRDIVDVTAAYRAIFGNDLGGGDAPTVGEGTHVGHGDLRDKPFQNGRRSEVVDEVIGHAGVDGTVTLIRGDSYTGNAAVIETVGTLLCQTDDVAAAPLDEWDLFGASWKGRSWKKLARGKSPRRTVWLIDDIDDKALAYSDLSTAMLDSSAFPKDAFVLSVRSADLSGELESWVARLRASRPGNYREITVPREDGPNDAAVLASILRQAMTELGHHAAEGLGPKKLIRQFLECLRAEERQLLEFMSVARFAMPLDLVLTVFPESSRETCSAILHLASLGCAEMVYRVLPGRNAISLFLRVRTTALRRRIYESIATQRRRKLHRTVALLAEQQEGFPKYLLLNHCLQSKQEGLCSRHVVSYLKETKPEQRHPNLLSLCVELARDNRLETASFADRIVANHELSAELVREGRGEVAEELLHRSLELIDNAEEDQTLKNAPRLSATLRLLADRWEARGEFKRALALLERAHTDLQSALSIPDQAQLLNDIGWLQYRLGDYARSMESCRLSLNTLSATQYPLIVAQALNLMGVVHFNTSRYDEAISYYEQSAYLRERAGDENALAASFNNLALAYQSKGEFEKAFDYHSKSLTLKKRRQNKAGMAAGYLNLAFLHLEARNFREAEQKCRESLAICEELGHAQLTAENYTTLGDIALEDGDFDKAEHHYRESRQISQQSAAINEEMGALRRLSSLCIKQERFDEAREYADAAFALVRRIGSRYENAQIEVVLGDLERQQGRHPAALEHYERAAAQFTALSKYRLAATVLSRIGLIHADTGDSFEAKNNFDRAQEFVRADIGRELPEEFVELRQALRARPARALSSSGEPERLLVAFQDLGALADYATDPQGFVRKLIDVVSRAAEPIECYVALKTRGGRFVLLDESGHSNPLLSDKLEVLFDRTLAAGGVVDSRSPDVTDLVSDLERVKSGAMACIPLKAMGDDLGCILLYVEDKRLPLSPEDNGFFAALGRQIAGAVKLMLHLNEEFLREEIAEPDAAPAGDSRGRYRLENLIGKSEAMRKIFRTLEKVRDADTGILILGESGTGKSALARVIHDNSPRRHHPFQEIHCAQIPHNLLESELFGHEIGAFTGAVRRKTGLCEAANGGTLFLDDINVMPVETQGKLLHFLESKSFIRLGGTQTLRADVRIITASNEDLEALCREGRFREDLYYRIKVILIDLPPLRERKEDMVAIALDYLNRSCAEKNIPLRTLSPETMQLFQRAPWRGNVRELQNVLERLVVLSEETLITPSSLPEDFLKEVTGTSRQTPQRLEELIDAIIELGSYSEENPLLPMLEALLAKRMVAHAEGKGRAASLLGISKPTLYARLRDYDKLH
jgi:DNA-binding NtrC family response regulator/tetratricopeptide (TPR) repeat protein